MRESLCVLKFLVAHSFPMKVLVQRQVGGRLVSFIHAVAWPHYGLRLLHMPNAHQTCPVNSSF